MPSTPTIKEIAAACNVSIATVSKALNNLPGIGADTAKRVKEKAKEMGYSPNFAARALKTNRSNSIGVLFVNDKYGGLRHEHLARVLDSIKMEAESNGYDMSFINGNIDGKEMTYLEHCKYRNYDGVVVCTVDYFAPQVVELIASDIPVVTIDYVFDGCGAVVSDNEQGMRTLTKHIIKNGHKKIAFIHGETSVVTKYRVTSFLNTCKEYGIEVPDEYLIGAHYHDTELSAEMTRELLKLDDAPTCIIYPDDISLIGGINELESQGLKVPDDISIAGYDGILISEIFRPKMTTIKQNAEALGQEAVCLLVKHMEFPKTYMPKRLIIPTELVKGETVRKIDS